MPLAPSEDFLTKKVGVLPVWGWGAVGLGIAYGWSRHQANKAATTSNTASTTTAAGESTDTTPQFIIENNQPGWDSVSQSVTVNPAPPVPITTPPGTTTTPPTTPVAIATPLGNPLVHPMPVGNPTGPTPAPPKQPTPTPSAQRYTVQKGDTLWGIAQKFYGNGTYDKTIWSYNQNPANRAGLPKIIGTNMGLIYPGEVFVIPPK